MDFFIIKYREGIATYVLAITIAIIVVMFFLSIKYIFSPINGFNINNVYIGAIGWLAIYCATIYLSLNNYKECLIIFIMFFIFGFLTQAYLEPISDQLDHLYRTYEKCENIDIGLRFNRGFWQYNMNALFVCQTKNTNISPSQVLNVIDLLHGQYIGIASVVIYMIGRISGLPPKWAFLALCTALFFMGTNKFSYFRYYSYSASFTSIIMYWLWIGFFYFNRKISNILLGATFSFFLVVIISVNHIQEAVFLSFLVASWLILNVTELIISKKFHKSVLTFWLVSLFIIFFILPQMKELQNIINIYFLNNLWEINNEVVYRWNNLHLVGKIWESKYRVTETIGLVGLVALLISPFILCWNQNKFSIYTRLRIVLLGILPFVIFCVPLCHYIWVSNVDIRVYYRIAYSSLFWCVIVYYLYMIETWMTDHHQ